MRSGSVRLAGIGGAALALSALAMPAHAQFGGLLGRVKPPQQERTADGCANGKSRSAGSQVLGSILGSAAGRAAARTGLYAWVPIAGLTDQLTAAIACKLDPEEQKQAARATLDVTRGKGGASEVAVGTTAAWTSETRENVRGTSTVVARNDDATAGLQCLTVSDVIIVQGEETRAEKRMCRQPPAARYALVA